MKTIEKIIKTHMARKNVAVSYFLTGTGADDNRHISIENEPYMRLVIESIGKGPRDFPMVSVCHYGEQNGDQMRDPEMTFEISITLDQWTWLPVSYRNDYVGVCQEGEAGAVFQRNGQTLMRPRLMRELKQFSNQWDRNIRDQGFLDEIKAAGMVAV